MNFFGEFGFMCKIVPRNLKISENIKVVLQTGL